MGLHRMMRGMMMKMKNELIETTVDVMKIIHESIEMIFNAIAWMHGVCFKSPFYVKSMRFAHFCPA